MASFESNSRPSSRYRIILSVICLVLWVILGWLATHSSATPEILGRYSLFWFALLIVVFVITLLVTISVLRNTDDGPYRIRYSVILLFVSLIFSIVLTEVFIRAFDPLGISYYEEAKRYHLYKLADEDLFYRHRPNIDEIYQGVRVTTNDLGLRDEVINSRKQQEYRILFLGDSVTFGWGVEADDSFVRKSEALLRKQTGRDIRAINSGVGGYNTRSEYSFLRRHGKDLQPDLIVLLYIGNDIEGTPKVPFDPWSANSFTGKSPPQAIKMVLGKSWLYRLVSHISAFWAGDTMAQPIDTASAGWRESAGALTALSQYSREYQIPLVVVLYRMQSHEPENSISVELQKLAAQEGFLFGDLIDNFSGQDPRKLINSIVDSHPNPQGHTIIANAIVELLKQNGLQPSSNIIDQALAGSSGAVIDP